MGTIANKIDKIKNTKDKIKTVTNLSTINTITSETIFKDYPKQILKEYVKIINNGTNELYNNFPKVEDEGIKLKLDTERGPLKITLEGNTSQDGIPTPETPVSIKVVTGEQNIIIQNKNLLPGKIFEHCTITNTGEKTIDESRACSDFIKVIPNDKYYLSYGVINGFTGIVFYDKNYNYISRIIWSNEISHIITIPNNIEYVKIFLQKHNPSYATENQFADDNVQFVKSDVATDYVEHQSQTYLLSLGNIELCRINDYKDYIFKNEISSPYYNADLDLNGWYLYKIIDKLTLNGSETYIYQSNHARFLYAHNISNLSIGDVNKSLCNYFVYGTKNNNFYINNTYLYLYASNYTSTDNFKNFIQEKYENGNALTVYIPLATPTNIKITDTTLISQLENIKDNARSYNDTTIIECSSSTDDNETIQVSTIALKNIN